MAEQPVGRHCGGVPFMLMGAIAEALFPGSAVMVPKFPLESVEMETGRVNSVDALLYQGGSDPRPAQSEKALYVVYAPRTSNVRMVASALLMWCACQRLPVEALERVTW